MFEPHQGNVTLDCEFDKMWDSLKMKGELSLHAEIEGKPFIAKATVAARGQHSGQRVIVFFFMKKMGNELNLQEVINAAGGIITTVMEPE